MTISLMQITIRHARGVQTVVVLLFILGGVVCGFSQTVKRNGCPVYRRGKIDELTLREKYDGISCGIREQGGETAGQAVCADRRVR